MTPPSCLVHRDFGPEPPATSTEIPAIRRALPDGYDDSDSPWLQLGVIGVLFVLSVCVLFQVLPPRSHAVTVSPAAILLAPEHIDAPRALSVDVDRGILDLAPVGVVPVVTAIRHVAPAHRKAGSAPTPARVRAFASDAVSYVPMDAPPTAPPVAVRSDYQLATIASKNLALIATRKDGQIRVVPYHVGDSLPDGSTITAIDVAHHRVLTSDGAIGSM